MNALSQRDGPREGHPTGWKGLQLIGAAARDERVAEWKTARRTVKYHYITSDKRRDPPAEAVKIVVRLRANGVCEGCESPAPFNDRHGRPFLEAHHIF